MFGVKSIGDESQRGPARSAQPAIKSRDAYDLGSSWNDISIRFCCKLEIGVAEVEFAL